MRVDPRVNDWTDWLEDNVPAGNEYEWPTSEALALVKAGVEVPTA